MAKKITATFTIDRDADFATDKQGVLAEFVAAAASLTIAAKEILRGHNIKREVTVGRWALTIKANL